MLQNSNLLLQVVDHVLLLLVHPACKRHQYQSERVHFGFLPSQTEEIQLEISPLLIPQPIESPQLTPQSNFSTLRGRHVRITTELLRRSALPAMLGTCSLNLVVGTRQRDQPNDEMVRFVRWKRLWDTAYLLRTKARKSATRQTLV